MSSIEIRKYEYQASRAKNYFSSPTFIDGITLNRILIEGFPIFNEEFVNEFDSFEYKASDYDLVFSRLDSTLTTSSQTLEYFLSNELDNHCLVCKVTIGGKVFGGLIDINSIKFIDNLDSDGYKIKITIFSMAKEFALATEGKQRQPSFTTHRINDFLKEKSVSNCMFYTVDSQVLPNYVDINTDNLDWVSRVGYEPVLVHELWAHIVNAGLADSASCWKLFQDLCTGFGLIYSFSYGGDVGNYFEITLSVAFRDTGFSGNALSINWLNRERGFVSDINANVIQCFKHQKAAGLLAINAELDIDENHFYGTVFNKDDITTADGDVYSVGGGIGEEGLFSNGDGLTINKLNDPFPFNVSDKVNFIEFNYYFSPYYSTGGTGVGSFVFGDARGGFFDGVRYKKYISFPRMFTKAGYTITEITTTGNRKTSYIAHPEGIYELWYDLVHNTAGLCYLYLLQTFKKSVNGKISLMSDFDVNIFDKITVNAEQHTIYKLSNLDFAERTVDLFAIQD